MWSPGLQIAMTVPSLEELDSFKYSDLQSLAKSLGLRANLRANKLLKALKTHLYQEARKENKNQDESQMSASSCGETEVYISSQKQAERKLAVHVTRTRSRHRAIHRNLDSQMSASVQTENKPSPVPKLDHSEVKSDHIESQTQEKQENQILRTVGIPSLPDESQGDENAGSSGRSGVNGHEDSNALSEIKKSFYTDGFSKSRKK